MEALSVFLLFIKAVGNLVSVNFFQCHGDRFLVLCIGNQRRLSVSELTGSVCCQGNQCILGIYFLDKAVNGWKTHHFKGTSLLIYCLKIVSICPSLRDSLHFSASRMEQVLCTASSNTSFTTM